MPDKKWVLTVSVPSILSGCFPKWNSFWRAKISKIPFPLKTATRGLYCFIFSTSNCPPRKQNIDLVNWLNCEFINLDVVNCSVLLFWSSQQGRTCAPTRQQNICMYIRGFQINNCVFQRTHSFVNLKRQLVLQTLFGPYYF